MPGRHKLIRAVGRWDLTALAINGIIGAGIFGLPASVAALVGSWSPVACLACGAIVLFIVLCFAEASSLFDTTGGPYLYAREAFGDPLGLASGWMMWLARASAFAANTNLFVSFLAYFFPWAGAGAQRAGGLIFVIGVLTWINIRGVRLGALVGDVLAVAKLAPLIAFVAIGFFAIKPELFFANNPISFAGFGQAILLYIYAFTGFEYAAIPAGEARAPKRHLPFALLNALMTAAVLYTGIQIVCVGTLPGLAQSQTAIADAGAVFMGSLGGQIIAMAALVSISGNLSGMVLISPRLTFALAEDGLLPAWLASVHARYRTPHLSIILFGALTMVMALSGTFVALVKISAIARIVPYGLTCLAIPALRKKYPDAPDRFRLRGGPTIPLVAVVLCLWLLWQSSWLNIAGAAAALAVGYGLYGGSLLWRRSRTHQN
jgi:APA family basic amino acid/polyamine antiporter